jgi:putative ABC transport system permease protein
VNALRRLLARRRLERDLADEIREHLRERVDELVAGGVPRDEAVYIALRAFGNPTLIEERARDVWRVPLLDDLSADLRYGLRQWRRTPALRPPRSSSWSVPTCRRRP